MTSRIDLRRVDRAGDVFLRVVQLPHRLAGREDRRGELTRRSTKHVDVCDV